MASSSDPFFLVRDDIEASVRVYLRREAGGCVGVLPFQSKKHSRSPHAPCAPLPPHNPFALFLSQLSKAQAALARWQALPPGAAERPRLAATVSDEARSLAWQTDEVEKAVKAAGRDPARFSLSPPELAARRAAL